MAADQHDDDASPCRIEDVERSALSVGHQRKGTRGIGERNIEDGAAFGTRVTSMPGLSKCSMTDCT